VATKRGQKFCPLSEITEVPGSTKAGQKEMGGRSKERRKHGRNIPTSDLMPTELLGV